MTRRLLLFLFAVMLGAAAPAFAGDDDGGGGNSGHGGGNSGPGGGNDDNSGPGGGDDDDDQSRARDAVGKGKAEKLNVVLKTVRARVKGDVVDVKLRHSSGRLTYRIKVLDSSGALVTVTVDATTGKVLRVAGGG